MLTNLAAVIYYNVTMGKVATALHDVADYIIFSKNGPLASLNIWLQVVTNLNTH